MVGCKLVFNFEQNMVNRIPLGILESSVDQENTKLTLYKKEKDGSANGYNDVTIHTVLSYISATGPRTLYKFWNNTKEYCIIGGEEFEYGHTWYLTMDSIEQVKEINRSLKRIVKEQEREAKVANNLDWLEELQKKFKENNPEYEKIEKQMRELEEQMKKYNQPPLNPYQPLGPGYPYQPGWPHGPQPGWPVPNSPGLPWDFTYPAKKDYIVETTTGTKITTIPPFSTTTGSTDKFKYSGPGYGTKIEPYSGVSLPLKD